jgi:BlaI family transcriptional regulator, penicillinase repressor
MPMALPKFTPLELQILEALWNQGRLSIRELVEAFPEKEQPAYTTVQTVVYRLEEKGAIRRVRKIGNAHIFEAVVTREAAKGRLLDEFLKLFGGNPRFVMAHLAEAGKLTLDDIREAEKLVQDLTPPERRKGGTRRE